MHVLLTTDGFSPLCGGRSWSAFELARAAQRRPVVMSR
jgi:hypothetical protein